MSANSRRHQIKKALFKDSYSRESSTSIIGELFLDLVIPIIEDPLYRSWPMMRVPSIIFIDQTIILALHRHTAFIDEGLWKLRLLL